MYKAKLYVVWEDGDGNNKLIPEEGYQSFLDELNDLELELGFPKGGWDDREKEEVQQKTFGTYQIRMRAQKEFYYVLLENDLIEGDSNMLIEEKFSQVCGTGVKGYEQTKKDGKF